jgi:hypothetical protein
LAFIHRDEVGNMASIREIAELAIANGFLSNTSIQHLKYLLKFDCEQEDMDALMRLHEAVVTGRVQDKSAIDGKPQSKKNPRGIVKMKLVCQTTFAAVIFGTIVFAVPKNAEQVILANDITATVDVRN